MEAFLFIFAVLTSLASLVYFFFIISSKAIRKSTLNLFELLPFHSISKIEMVRLLDRTPFDNRISARGYSAVFFCGGHEKLYYNFLNQLCVRHINFSNSFAYYLYARGHDIKRDIQNKEYQLAFGQAWGEILSRPDHFPEKPHYYVTALYMLTDAILDARKNWRETHALPLPRRPFMVHLGGFARTLNRYNRFVPFLVHEKGSDSWLVWYRNARLTDQELLQLDTSSFDHVAYRKLTRSYGQVSVGTFKSLVWTDWMHARWAWLHDDDAYRRDLEEQELAEDPCSHLDMDSESEDEFQFNYRKRRRRGYIPTPPESSGDDGFIDSDENE